MSTKKFGATGLPHTCFWCGFALVRNVDTRLVFSFYSLDDGEDMADAYDYVAIVVSKPLGKVSYGALGDGYFCDAECGYRFGRSLARKGKRL